MNYEALKYIYQPSENPGAATLLLLHGTGGDERDLLPLAANYGKDFNILSLRGNVSENGMPRFFKRLGMGIFDEKDLDFRTHEMVAFIRQLAEKEQFDSSKIVALGYSNGANIAGSTLVLYPDFLAGAILFRPMKPFKSISDWQTTAKVPVFLSTGKSDPTIRPEDTQEWVSLLKKAGFEVTHAELNASHNLTHQDLQLSAGWFKEHFQ